MAASERALLVSLLICWQRHSIVDRVNGFMIIADLLSGKSELEMSSFYRSVEDELLQRLARLPHIRLFNSPKVIFALIGVISLQFIPHFFLLGLWLIVFKNSSKICEIWIQIQEFWKPNWNKTYFVPNANSVQKHNLEVINGPTELIILQH